MDEVFKQKFEEFGKLQKERKEQVVVDEEYHKQFVLGEENKIDKWLHIIAIGILNDRGFKWEKERVDGDARLKLSGQTITRCRFKCRTWNSVGFTHGYDLQKLGHEVFDTICSKILDLIEKDEEENPKLEKYSRYNRYDSQDTEKPKVKEHIIFEFDEREIEEADTYTFEIKKRKIECLKFSLFEEGYKTDGKEVLEVFPLLHDDFIFEQAKKLSQKIIEEYDKRKAAHEINITKIEQLLKDSKLDSYLILNSL